VWPLPITAVVPLPRERVARFDFEGIGSRFGITAAVNIGVIDSIDGVPAGDLADSIVPEALAIDADVKWNSVGGGELGKKGGGEKGTENGEGGLHYQNGAVTWGVWLKIRVSVAKTKRSRGLRKKRGEVKKAKWVARPARLKGLSLNRRKKEKEGGKERKKKVGSGKEEKEGK
jgi:hypothetical protein